MSETKFKQYLQTIDWEHDRNLKELFEFWKEAHKKETEDLLEKMDKSNISKEEFEQKIYYKTGNTISSHFAQFFDKECENCSKSNESVEKPWELVLQKAFNMDGTYKNYEVREKGYRYICLLKEANDSKKVCVNDYLTCSDIVNQWVIDDGKDICDRKYKSDMLSKLNEAFFRLNENETSGVQKKDFDFTEHMAFMNVNKRGGTSTTAGRDETAVIEYARKYKEFILQEIEILTKKGEAIVFVCGGKSYFWRLMRALFDKEVEGNIEENGVFVKDKITYKQIPHPSYWKITSQKLTEEMQK